MDLASAEVQKSTEPIYLASRLCSALFDECLAETPVSAEAYTTVEELCGRFKTWAAYVGAFAVPKASLDARLTPHEDIRNMVLDLLTMLERNLQWAKSHPDKVDPEASLGLPAVESAIERLFIIAVAIRHSARHPRTVKEENNSGDPEPLCSLLLQTRYPNARKSLRDQLAHSIRTRGMSLQYRESHNRKLAHQREIRVQESGPLADNGIQQAVNVSEQTQDIGHFFPVELETNPSLVSPSAVLRVLGAARKNTRPSRSIASVGTTVKDTAGGDLPYPPIPKAGLQRACSCPICSEQLGSSKLTEEGWKTHVNEDLEPYVCISEDCKEPLQFFSRMRNWMEHMQTRHSFNWAQKIHTEQWYCDINHTESPDFNTKEDLISHLKADHGNRLTNSQLQGRARRNRRIATRDPFVCPLCDCVPDDLKTRVAEKPFNLLSKHIGQHLISLSFQSLSYLDIDLGDGESASGSIRGSEALSDPQVDVGDNEKRENALQAVGALADTAFDNIPETEVFDDGTCRVGNDLFSSEPALRTSEDWKYLPLRTLETDWEYLQKHLSNSTEMLNSVALNIPNRETENADNNPLGVPNEGFGLVGVPEEKNYVDRPLDRAKIERCLVPLRSVSGRSNRPNVFVIWGLGGIGKTELAASFARRHYSRFHSILWVNGSSRVKLNSSFIACAAEILTLQRDIKSPAPFLRAETHADDQKRQSHRLMRDVARKGIANDLPGGKAPVSKPPTVPESRPTTSLESEPDPEPYLYTVRPDTLHDLPVQIKIGGSSTPMLPYEISAEEYHKMQNDSSPDAKESRHRSRREGWKASTTIEWLSLQSSPNWLLVFDNVQDFKTIQPFLDRFYRCSVLITTRLSPPANFGQSMRLAKADPELSKAIFEQWYGAKQVPDCEQLLSELDGLPLALAKVALLLALNQGDIASYILAYETSWLLMVRTLSRLSGDSQSSVATTWIATLDDIGNKSTNALFLLRFWAFLDSKEPPWQDLIRPVGADHLDTEWSEWSSFMWRDKVALEEALALLYDHSMIEKETSGYVMHRFVQQWVSRLYGLQTMTKFLSLALEVVGGSVPRQDPVKYRSIGLRLLPLAEKGLWWLRNISSDSFSQILQNVSPESLHSLGLLFAQHGKLMEAEKMYTWAVSNFELTRGADHLQTWETIHCLGLLHKAQGKLEEAEQELTRASRGFQRLLGPHHTTTLSAFNNLGHLYITRGYLELAEETLFRAHRGFEMVPGPYEASSLNTLNNIGLLFISQGKLKEAEAMLIRALKSCDELMWIGDPLTIHTAKVLGDLYHEQGRQGEASKMYERAKHGESTWNRLD